MKNIIVITGFVLSILGTILIWVDSQNSIKVLSDLLEEIALRDGFWQDAPIESEKIIDFKQTIQKAAKLDIKGFILLMFGFVLQGFSFFNFKRTFKD